MKHKDKCDKTQHPTPPPTPPQNFLFPQPIDVMEVIRVWRHKLVAYAVICPYYARSNLAPETKQ